MSLFLSLTVIVCLSQLQILTVKNFILQFNKIFYLFLNCKIFCDGYTSLPLLFLIQMNTTKKTRNKTKPVIITIVDCDIWALIFMIPKTVSDNTFRKLMGKFFLID
jgi:hypothetical protein